uniref:Translation initiation factor eIF2B subunit gamma n=1 Tax=Polyblepharides amylifera TaxID=1486889 RepID=A0A7R9SVV9_9CHLO|mmetsp:Transcript_94/g.131  ORF Transcript_94/g.131 Transcript_94/m.131 type:complete len:472 (+) Transcript_94:191-1606(+)|eukprot:CAMPEP_0196575502 /NCGR_PEP_ID=MMETSP1081-20130531/4966_1 /TAXON_ID=36882 /ORGANISM="Pyramimonas amylifera, Strain CCMP720" /LENGTH=471 /DNA_ID=CAMNT_0041893825 /DNA_START=184 /DNA_END=1599 /DNA_ORIENTATION=+
MTVGFQAVVLAGGMAKRFGVLNADDMPKSMIPVGNRPLLSYSLDALEAAGFTDILLMMCGDAAARGVARLVDSYSARMRIQVVTSPEESGTAQALRSVQDRLLADNILIVSGDLICDGAAGLLVKAHLSRHAPSASLLIGPRPQPPESGGKLKPEDYIGLCPRRSRLLFMCSGASAGKELRVRRALLSSGGQIDLHTDLQDAHFYIFSRKKLLSVLDAHPNMTSIKEHVLPYMARRQFSEGSGLRKKPSGAASASSSPVDAAEPRVGKGPTEDPTTSAPETPQQQDQQEEEEEEVELGGKVGMYGELLGAGGGVEGGGVYAELVKDKYVIRVNSLDTYCDANRDVAQPGVAAHLTGFTLSKYDNVVDKTAELGNRTTIGPGCIVGAQCVLGDRSSIRRSVLGKGVKLANNVKIINSVVGEGAHIEEGCHVQGSVVCAGAMLGEKSSLRDCQVAAGYHVPANIEYRSEELAN